MDVSYFRLLKDRYGDNFDYTLLSEEQILFLLNIHIRDNQDSTGNKTVSIIDIKKNDNIVLLNIKDIFYYLFRKNAPGNVSGSKLYGLSHRIPIYNKILNLTDMPLMINNYVYLFKLKNNYQIMVEFDVLKDKP